MVSKWRKDGDGDYRLQEPIEVKGRLNVELWRGMPGHSWMVRMNIYGIQLHDVVADDPEEAQRLAVKAVRQRLTEMLEGLPKEE